MVSQSAVGHELKLDKKVEKQQYKMEGRAWDLRKIKLNGNALSQRGKQKSVNARCNSFKPKPVFPESFLPGRSSHVLFPGVTARLPATTGVLFSSWRNTKAAQSRFLGCFFLRGLLLCITEEKILKGGQSYLTSSWTFSPISFANKWIKDRDQNKMKTEEKK